MGTGLNPFDITLLLCILAIAAIAARILRNYKFGKCPNGIPLFQQSTWWWIRKALLEKESSIVTSCFQCFSAYATVHHKEGAFQFSVLSQKFVGVYKANLIKELLNNPNVQDRSHMTEVMQPALGRGLITSNGSRWRHHRKILTPSFSVGSLNDYIPIFNHHAALFVDKLKGFSHESWIELDSLTSLFSLAVICESAMGINFSHFEGNSTIERYFRAMKELEKAAISMHIKPWARSKVICSFLSVGKRVKEESAVTRGFLRKVIETKKQSILSNMKDKETESNAARMTMDKSERKLFLEQMLEHHFKNPNFTMEDIQDEVDTFIAAGSATAAVAIKWTLFLLGLHPDIQENVVKELESVFGSDYNKQVTFDDLQNLQYMECTIKEVLRLYPPVPITDRKVKEDIKIGSFIFRRDSVILANLYMLHRDPDMFPNPEKFLPERFFPENRERLHSHAFLPFSAGARTCVGYRFALMELKVVISHILRNFRVISLSQRDQVELFAAISLKNQQPLKVRLINRNEITVPVF